MIAILMSTYNGEDYIKEQINSFFSQTCNEWQLYVHDDGSMDDTVSIIMDYAERYPDKVFYISEPDHNVGAGVSFMSILDKVDADYYMFSDQDDVWMNNKIERTYKKILSLEKEHGKHIPIGVFTDLTVVDENLNTIMSSLWKGDNRHPEYVRNFYKQWTNRHASYGCTQMFNRAARKLILPYKQFPNVQGAHDNWVEYCLIAKGVYDYLDEQTIHYRQHGSNAVGANFGHSYSDELHEILKNPSLFFTKIMKDYVRIKLMPFHISLAKVYWYRIYQSFTTLFNLK